MYGFAIGNGITSIEREPNTKRTLGRYWWTAIISKFLNNKRTMLSRPCHDEY